MDAPVISISEVEFAQMFTKCLCSEVHPCLTRGTGSIEYGMIVLTLALYVPLLVGSQRRL